MKLSPQSEAIIRELRLRKRIQSGEVVLEPLDDHGLVVLKVLIDQFEDLSVRKGQDQAAALRTHYGRCLQANTPGRGVSDATAEPVVTSEPGDGTDATSANWRLIRLRCRSIRGIASPGEEFEFEFHGESNLIYGPNGSGKSSMIGAVVWVLTGDVVTDSGRRDAEAPMYRAAGQKKAGSKLRDWPVVATLPDAALAESAVPDSWAELELTCPEDGKQLWLRRSHGEELESSTDMVDWAVCPSLTRFGIAPLDLQLSLLAPTVFGRTAIEDAEDTRSLLSLMLGFDDLEQFGDLASKLARNRTMLGKAERKALGSKQDDLKRHLKQLAEFLPDEGPGKQELLALQDPANLSVDNIVEAGEKIDSVLNAAQAELATIIGLEVDGNHPPDGIADQLTVAVAKLEQGVWGMFPRLNSLRLEVALPPGDAGTPEEQLVALKAALEAFVQEASVSISERAEWWERETVPGSKARMLLGTAEFYDDQTEACPVCDRRIEDQELKDHLVSLKHVDPKMCTELRTFFGDLCREFSEVLPPPLVALGRATIPQVITSDWSIICRDVLGSVFSQLASEYAPKIRDLWESLDVAPVTEVTLLPEGVDDKFRSAAADLLATVREAYCAVSLLEGGKAVVESIAERVHRIVTAIEEDNAKSLYSILSKGKDSAEAVKPLALVKRGLIQARKLQESIDTACEGLRELETLVAPLDNLKALAKYAESEVRSTFDAIRDTTVANLGELYPGASTGLKVGRLRLGKGRDKTVESLLSNTSYEVPGQFFANAGLQRAVALSFYFALLRNHGRGLGFILMDDPILSLDEEHRELWSARLLRPNLAEFQVILATHQSQYLNNCRTDFSADRVVELNPRDRTQCVSWHPGDRLLRAEKQLETDWRTAATTMRKFGEDVLIPLDAYSPDAFFSKGNLASSLEKYRDLFPPHPLAGSPQRKIVALLKDPAVTRVLNPGSHSMTEADVTKPMAEECLAKLMDCQSKVNRELVRLEAERKRALRASVIPASVIRFAQLPAEATWDTAMEFRLIGAVAARSAPWVVDVADDGDRLTVMPGAAVLVSDNTLDPVAKCGQWVLLAPEDILPNDGDLVALNDAEGNRYLRRIWSDGENWVLQSVNPVTPVPSVLVEKRAAAARRVIGVVYEPVLSISPSSDRTTEWFPATHRNLGEFAKCQAIKVEGNSLDPIARPGQKVLVDEKCDALDAVNAGTLAVVESSVDAVGNVVKRVFPRSDEWILVSPNPVDAIPPDVLATNQISSIRRVRGVLFETAEATS